MKRMFFVFTLMMLPMAAVAGGPGTVFDDPVVAAPAPSFSWSGPYAGLTYGTSSHTREYTRTYDEDITTQKYTDWEKHAYSCNRGKGHFGYKCDVTGLDAPEFSTLDNVQRPWSNARDETVRYSSGYEGLWMGAHESFAFTLPSYVAPVDRGSNWAQIDYEHLTGTHVEDITQTVTRTETYTRTDSDTNYGAFVGYRHQFAIPFVVGIEGNFIQTDSFGSFEQLGVQAGVAAGRVLPYIEAGADHYAGGVDVALGQRGKLLVGVRTWETHDGDDKGTQLRIGWNF